MIEPTLAEVWRLFLILLGGIGGTTFAVATRHLTSRNYNWGLEDNWYYVLCAGVSIGAWLFGGDWTSGFLLTSGINTPLALARNAVNAKTNGKDKAAQITALEEKIAKLRK
jgi:hypothetical protein